MTVQLSGLKPACMRYCPWELAVNRWEILLILVLLSFPSRLGRCQLELQVECRTTSRWSLPDTSDKFRSPAVNLFKRGFDVIKPMGAIPTPFFQHLCENIQPLKRSPQALTGSKRPKRGQHIQIMWRAVQGSSTDRDQNHLLILLDSGISILLTFNWLIQQSFDNWVGDYTQIAWQLKLTDLITGDRWPLA